MAAPAGTAFRISCFQVRDSKDGVILISSSTEEDDTWQGIRRKLERGLHVQEYMPCLHDVHGIEDESGETCCYPSS